MPTPAPRRRLLLLAFDVLGAWHARRKPPIPPATHLLAHDPARPQPPRGLRLTERLRDLLRPGWLRLRRP